MSTGPAPRPTTAVHLLLAVTVATGAWVRWEPAPYDLLMLATLAFGPLLVWPSLRASLVLPAALAAALLLANGVSLAFAIDLGRGLAFFGVTLYLMLSFAMIALWLDRLGTSLLRTVLHAYAVAALLGGAVAVAAYFGALPGAALMLPKGRLLGLFKDANVFGAFMVPAVVLGVARLSSERRGALRWTAVVLVGIVAVLLSYSRGSWINLGTGLVTYAGLRLVSGRVRPTLGTVLGACVAVAVVAGLLMVMIDHPHVRSMLELRATTQGYDDDRFGNQADAVALAWEHPLGLGPGATEGHLAISAHSLYVRALVENGALGLWATVALLLVSQVRVVWTVLAGGGDPETQRLLAVVAGALAGMVVESAVIDTIHWRHLWLVLALAWAPRTSGDPLSDRFDPLRHRGGSWRRPAR
jgi:O-antigen ligase